jgi:hypothetical protein
MTWHTIYPFFSKLQNPPDIRVSVDSSLRRTRFQMQISRPPPFPGLVPFKGKFFPAADRVSGICPEFSIPIINTSDKKIFPGIGIFNMPLRLNLLN